ncbi:hypothetical protein HG535_0D01900 [Zygotorulaspora mrakii]|uniref:Mannosyltransferase n=1 Tax=Zygotorulaspora mrakii TaxID=42260 RepID=A0A7H9B419_ZYGMR|nr:uncharacterized protein HG535_0D01900 [Zygotorulaspora mrakii]QLG72482.1 hypothetical protein HG535_0D01900 [Zygotorulaspora mrakii]
MLKWNLHFKRRCRRILGKYRVIISCLVIILFPTLLVLTLGARNSSTSLANEEIITKRDGVFFKGCVDTPEYLEDPYYTKMNATFVMLTRNEEMDEVLKTMQSIETHFNQWFQYPYVFLNNEPFTEEFKLRITSMTNAEVDFGMIEETDWEFPEDIRDTFAFKNAIQEQGDRGILYAHMESYHKMCRFYSGIFYKHPLVRRHEWYWRLEPDVEFFCDISYDPFYEMAKTNKKYGFTVVLPEIYWSVPNLFRYTRAFIRENRVKVGNLWNLFVTNYDILDTDDEELSEFVNHEEDVEPKMSEKVAIDHMFDTKEFDEDSMGMHMLIRRAKSKIPTKEDKFDNQEYNLCHFWSNFEIARIDVFDNDFYNSYFEFLEKSGGFWRERWGDAPIHSLGLGMMLDVDDIHYFRDIGYRHADVQHCPKNWNGFQQEKKVGHGQLPYMPFEDRFKRRAGLWNSYDTGTAAGSGCRCKCSKRRKDIEDRAYECIDLWASLVSASDSFLESGGFVPNMNAQEIESSIERDYESHFAAQ